MNTFGPFRVQVNIYLTQWNEKEASSFFNVYLSSLHLTIDCTMKHIMHWPILYMSMWNIFLDQTDHYVFRDFFIDLKRTGQGCICFMDHFVACVLFIMFFLLFLFVSFVGYVLCCDFHLSRTSSVVFFQLISRMYVNHSAQLDARGHVQCRITQNC